MIAMRTYFTLKKIKNLKKKIIGFVGLPPNQISSLLSRTKEKRFNPFKPSERLSSTNPTSKTPKMITITHSLITQATPLMIINSFLLSYVKN